MRDTLSDVVADQRIGLSVRHVDLTRLISRSLLGYVQLLTLFGCICLYATQCAVMLRDCITKSTHHSALSAIDYSEMADIIAYRSG